MENYRCKNFEKDSYLTVDEYKLQTNFDYKRIQSLYSNLSLLIYSCYMKPGKIIKN